VKDPFCYLMVFRPTGSVIPRLRGNDFHQRLVAIFVGWARLNLGESSLEKGELIYVYA
jgi:hypothetical protein